MIGITEVMFHFPTIGVRRASALCGLIDGTIGPSDPAHFPRTAAIPSVKWEALTGYERILTAAAEAVGGRLMWCGKWLAVEVSASFTLAYDSQGRRFQWMHVDTLIEARKAA